jgi:cysteinyl-tRNA synthetase
MGERGGRQMSSSDITHGVGIMGDKDPKAPSGSREAVRRRIQTILKENQRERERDKARMGLAKLVRERYAALKAGDSARADEIMRQMKALNVEIKRRFGY